MTREHIRAVPEHILDAIALDPDFPKGTYAYDVLHGYQWLSGSDLKGKARSYGAWYAEQRRKVMAVAAKHGVGTAYDADNHGKLTWTLI